MEGKDKRNNKLFGFATKSHRPRCFILCADNGYVYFYVFQNTSLTDALSLSLF